MYARHQDGSVDYSEVVPCKCQREEIEKRRAASLLKFCALPAGSEWLTFASFNAKSRVLREALEAARELAENTGDLKWLTLAGDVDHGKTHLAIAIARRWLERGLAAKYCLVPKMLKELRDGFDMDGEDSYRRRFDVLCKVGLLVLDDLGTENVTAWGLEQLQMLIHLRGMDGLPLVVTTNNPLDCLFGNDNDNKRIAGMRIASRLQRESWCRVIVLDGQEHRLW